MLRKILATLLITAASSQAGAAADGFGLSQHEASAPLLLAEVSTAYGKEEAWIVEIVIKPGSDTTEIPIRTERVFPVAILGSEQLDITLLNPRTIRVTAAGKKLVGRADTRSCLRQDVDGDGHEDLVCDVKTVAYKLEPGEILLMMEAETYQHQKLKGEGTIIVIAN